MAMCPFESMAKQRTSDFCSLFIDEEFKQFEYHGDVEKYYKTGYVFVRIIEKISCIIPFTDMASL